MNVKKRDILVSLFVVVLYFLWPYILSAVNSFFNLSDLITLYISFSVNFVFLFIVLYIYRNLINESFGKLKKGKKENLVLSIKIFLVGLAIYTILSILLGALNIPISNNQVSMKEIMKKIPIIFVLNTLFYYPIIEELVFKLSFKDILKNKWSFIIITGIFNALFQIVFSFGNITDLLYLLPYSIFFSTLSYIYYKTNNIIYPIFLRICYNLIPCIIVIRNLLH